MMTSPEFEFFSLDHPPGVDWVNLSLNAEERAREKNFRFEVDQRRFANGRRYLRVALAAAAGVEVEKVELMDRPGSAPCASVSGEPLRLFWSFSRAGSTGALVVADRPAGIDIEEWREIPDALDVAADQFSPDEGGYLRALPTDERSAAFLRLWTAKEALVKATGKGLGPETVRFTVKVQGSAPEIVNGEGAYQPGLWQLYDIGDSQSVCGTLALQSAERPSLLQRSVP